MFVVEYICEKLLDFVGKESVVMKNIIFDCSDTLLRFTAKDVLAAEIGDRERAYKIHNTIYSSAAWTQYDLGNISFDEMKREALELLDGEDRVIADNYLDTRADNYEIIEGMPELLGSLREAGYNIYLISNFPDYFDVLWNRFEIFRLIHERFVSCEYHASKGNDGRLFDVFLEKTGCSPDECVFIDDLDFLVENALRRGMAGIVFENLESLIQSLRGLKVNI